MSAKRPKTGGRNRRKCRVRTAFLPQLREKKEKIRPKIKKHCQKQAKGDMIDKNSKRKRVGFAIAIYPREGTETQRSSHIPARSRLQFIPARGRKPRHEIDGHAKSDCNLSPRGDGNVLLDVSKHEASQLQFIPARGRKLYTSILELLFLGQDCNLSPRGDGNRPARQFIRVGKIAIYPREGTETIIIWRKLPSSSDCNLSPRGDGNHLTSTLQRFLLIAIYPREGRKRKQ